MKTLFIIAFKFNRLPTASVDKADFDEDRKKKFMSKTPNRKRKHWLYLFDRFECYFWNRIKWPKVGLPVVFNHFVSIGKRRVIIAKVAFFRTKVRQVVCLIGSQQVIYRGYGTGSNRSVPSLYFIGYWTKPSGPTSKQDLLDLFKRVDSAYSMPLSLTPFCSLSNAKPRKWTVWSGPK